MWPGPAPLLAAPGPEGGNPSGTPAPSLERLTRTGDRLFNAGQYDAALAEYQKALALARERRQPQAECNLLNNLAAVYMAQGNLELFQRAFAQARDCQWQRQQTAPAPAARPAGGNLLVNGGFEEGLAHPWGTGHYESLQGKSRFGIWWNSMNARAFMKIDTDQSHSGEKSLRITNYSPAQPHGLKPNTVYRLSLYAKADNLRGGISVITDAAWGKRLILVPPGTYDWKHCRGSVNIGHNDYIDLRLVSEHPGTAWLDDLAVEEELDPASPEALLQKAESLYDRAQFREALVLCQDLERSHPGNASLLLHTRHLTGRIHLALGRYEEARSQFQGLADAKFRPAPIALGDLYYQLGEFDRANDYYRQALDLFRGDQGTYSRIHEKLAASFLAQGKWNEALKAQSLALQVQQHIGDVYGQALVLNTTGLMLLQKRDYDQALKALSAAVKLARQVNDPRLLAHALLNQGETLVRLQRLDAARASAAEGLRLAQDTGEARTRLQALYLRARLNRQTGQAEKALADYRAAVALLQELYTHLGVTPRETRQAFLTQFADLYQDYIDLLLERYQQEPRPDYREEAFQRSEEARARLFAEMVNEVRAAQSFAAAAQNPELVRLVAKEREARLQLEALRRHQSPLQENPATQRSPTPPADLDRQQARVLEDLRRLQDDLRRQFPRYADLKNPQPLTFAELQKLLEPDEAVVSYFVTPRRTAVWALNRDSVALAVLPGGRQALRQGVRPFIENFARAGDAVAAYGQSPGRAQAGQKLQAAFGAFNLNAAQALYQTLVAPVAEVLTGKRLIYLAPDDLLYQLPFEALLTGAPPAPAAGTEETGGELKDAPFWIKTQSLAYLPSVSVLRSLRTLAKDPPASQKPLLAFADPIFDTDPAGTSPPAAGRRARLQVLRGRGAISNVTLPRLPETADEARRAAQTLGGREEDVYLQLRATEHNLKNLPLASYRTLLFATHGLMAGEFRPGIQPALALTFVGDPDNDGLLEMGEILGLDLRARLVVLSACNTGLSSAAEDRGEGFAGLTRSFMYAGSESLVVTLWSVESKSAANLMGDFYAALPQKNRASALADAKRAMITKGGSVPLGHGSKLPLSHPYFWAPYVLVGEGR
jgi:CHAT domain-containing protein/tetratricopeptide (TPR) repeat protein